MRSTRSRRRREPRERRIEPLLDRAAEVVDSNRELHRRQPYVDATLCLQCVIADRRGRRAQSVEYEPRMLGEPVAKRDN